MFYSHNPYICNFTIERDVAKIAVQTIEWMLVKLEKNNGQRGGGGGEREEKIKHGKMKDVNCKKVTDRPQVLYKLRFFLIFLCPSLAFCLLPILRF